LTIGDQEVMLGVENFNNELIFDAVGAAWKIPNLQEFCYEGRQIFLQKYL
jgi:hypothetical protein